jgi:hypothetical protein
MATNGYYDISGLFIGFYKTEVLPPIPVTPKKRLQFTRTVHIDPEITLNLSTDLKTRYNISEDNITCILGYFTTINTTFFRNKKIVNIIDIYLLWSIDVLPENINTVFAPIFQDSQFYINNNFWGLFPIIKEIFTQKNIPYEESYVHFCTIYILWYITHLSFSTNIENDLLKKLVYDMHYEMNIINGDYKKAFGNGKLSMLIPHILEDNQFEIIQKDELKTIIKTIYLVNL